ncbi:hypothetical protein AA103196_2587 [Ameyamaea chiangmaiensis NBRC 103196]|uniref:Uncharacterized protein n=1 Tax=Ameyamaea chiangmaiensis TaxID=442969 RepID=A0A850PCA0_9PROT|nr:hypothetical protein [Ameyamaea chiangmaiensis]MBS4075611.1 hypothetical protein [Ameyamaea chiangmaiensis]NVN40150.1 hypothetical protein [Ameyamaea chiangmaiensis]GBQ70763.1 hypothetical protein AA103196_2587 [Ameyamaea chiangmaiensis NBRC 103196]
MSIGDRVNQFDEWLLDRVFQPVADRLPERLTALEIGMSFQLGALLLSAVSIGAMVVIGHLGFGDAMFNVLTWSVGLAFFVGINRVRPLVKPGHLNPLRPMLAGMRPLSIPFAIYSLWQGVTAPPGFELAMWFNSLANMAYVLGTYLISCTPRPPGYRQARRAPAFRTVRGEA